MTKPSPEAIHTHFAQSVIANMMAIHPKHVHSPKYFKESLSVQKRCSGRREFMINLSGRLGLLIKIANVSRVKAVALFSAIFDHENLNVSNLP